MRLASAPPHETDVTSIYPELPTTVTKEQDSTSFRLQEVGKLQKRLEGEKVARATLYKKYKRGVNALDGVDTALLATGMGLGVGGVCLLSTVLAAPVVLGLEIAALGCALGIVGCKSGSRKLQKKAKNTTKYKSWQTAS